MTRKDYELIAAAVKRALDADTTPRRVWAIETVAQCLAADLAVDNPRFNRATFLAACGVQS